MGLNLNILGFNKVRPPIPTLGTLVVISDTQINIPYASSYQVEIWYSTDNITFTKHGDSTATPYEATGLTQGTLYYFKARVKNGSKYSAFGSAVNGHTDFISLADGDFLQDGIFLRDN